MIWIVHIHVNFVHFHHRKSSVALDFMWFFKKDNQQHKRILGNFITSKNRSQKVTITDNYTL